MFAKSVKGKSFFNALDYDLKKGAILSSNLADTSSVQAMTSEFMVVSRLRPNLKKVVLHTSLAIPPGEHLSDDQWIEVAEIYLHDMGFEKNQNQYVISKHTDTEHEHIHIVANRVSTSNTVVSDSNDFKRQSAIMRKVEKMYNLRVLNSEPAQVKAPKKSEIEMMIRTEEPSIKLLLQTYCEQALAECSDFSDYVRLLNEKNIDVVPTLQLNEEKLSGIVYVLKNKGIMKGSDLGKKFTAAGIQKNGADYDKIRDAETINRCRNREAIRIGCLNDENKRNRPTDSGVIGSDNRVEQVNDKFQGKNHRTEQYDGQIEPIDASERENISEFCDDNDRIREENNQFSRNNKNVQLDNSNVNNVNVPPNDKSAGNNGNRNIGIDNTVSYNVNTAEIVKNQVEAMNCDVMIGLKNIKTGAMINKKYQNKEVLLNSIKYLRYMNAFDNDVYIKPVGNHALVLLDDVNAESIIKMKNDDCSPSIIVETSPKNYQVWLRASENPVLQNRLLDLSRIYTDLYNADKNAIGSDRYGRLAGFTNKKEKYKINDVQPFVRLIECNGNIANAVKNSLYELNKPVESFAERAKKYTKKININNNVNFAELYKSLMVLNKDRSVVDWIFVNKLIENNCNIDTIKQELLKNSFNIQERKIGHVDDYVDRTVKNAWEKFYEVDNTVGQVSEIKQKPKF